MLISIKNPEYGSSKILQNYKSALRHIPEDFNLHNHKPLDSVTGGITYAIQHNHLTASSSAACGEVVGSL
jgi:hypothetical protein